MQMIILEYFKPDFRRLHRERGTDIDPMDHIEHYLIVHCGFPDSGTEGSKGGSRGAFEFRTHSINMSRLLK